MSRQLTIVASWLGATCAATLLVAAGVGTIRDATRRDAALAAPNASGVIGFVTGAPTSTSTTTGSIVVPSPPSSNTAASPSTTVAVATPPTRPPVTTVEGVPATSPTTPPATVPPPPAPSTTIAGPSTFTIASSGGTVTVRASASSVVVVVATPNPGFTTRIDQRGDTAIRVEFESASHRSRVEAWWDGGPRQDVREDS